MSGRTSLASVLRQALAAVPPERRVPELERELEAMKRHVSRFGTRVRKTGRARLDLPRALELAKRLNATPGYEPAGAGLFGFLAAFLMLEPR